VNGAAEGSLAHLLSALWFALRAEQMTSELLEQTDRADERRSIEETLASIRSTLARRRRAFETVRAIRAHAIAEPA